MSHTDWHDCDFVGTIRVYNKQKPVKEPIEIIDDYDMRHEFGCRVTKTRSRIDKEEM